jgi:hypothetical protein
VSQKKKRKKAERKMGSVCSIEHGRMIFPGNWDFWVSLLLWFGSEMSPKAHVESLVPTAAILRGEVGKWLDHEVPDVINRLINYGYVFLCFLAPRRWAPFLIHAFPQCCMASCMYGLEPLKPWDKTNLSSSKLFSSGILSQQQKADLHTQVILLNGVYGQNGKIVHLAWWQLST